MIGYRGPQQSPLFGLGQPSPPQGDLVQPGAAVPPQAFQWGAGGGRLTPEDIAMRRKMAMQNIAEGSSYAPVAHWTQGLARVAQALVGGMENRKLDKAAQQNATAEQQILASLTGGGAGASNDQAMIGAMSSPYLSEDAKGALKLQYQTTHRAAPQPSEFERTLLATGVRPGTPQWTRANQARLQNYTDPTINVPLPGGRVYVGPRSQLPTYAGGGDPTSTAPVGGAQPPATLPPDFNFDAGGPTQPASATFR